MVHNDEGIVYSFHRPLASGFQAGKPLQNKDQRTEYMEIEQVIEITSPSIPAGN